MLLTKFGKKILKLFQKKYGKIKGKRLFYSKIDKRPRRTERWYK